MCGFVLVKETVRLTLAGLFLFFCWLSVRENPEDWYFLGSGAP
jgi:hypothetical protein